MGNFRMDSSFQLAFWRAFFLLIILVVYLLFGTLTFWVLSHGNEQQKLKVKQFIILFFD